MGVSTLFVMGCEYILQENETTTNDSVTTQQQTCGKSVTDVYTMSITQSMQEAREHSSSLEKAVGGGHLLCQYLRETAFPAGW